MTTNTRPLSSYEKLLFATLSETPKRLERFQENLRVRGRRTAEIFQGRIVTSSSLAKDLIGHLKKLSPNALDELNEISRLFENALLKIKHKKAIKLRCEFERELNALYKKSIQEKPGFEQIGSESTDEEPESFRTISVDWGIDSDLMSSEEFSEKEEVNKEPVEIPSLLTLSLKKVFTLPPQEFKSPLPSDLAEVVIQNMHELGVTLKSHHIDLLALTSCFVLYPFEYGLSFIQELFTRCDKIALVTIYPAKVYSNSELWYWQNIINYILDLVKEGRRFTFTIPETCNAFSVLHRIDWARALEFWEVLEGASKVRCILESFNAFGPGYYFVDDRFRPLQTICQNFTDEEIAVYKALLESNHESSLAHFILCVMGKDHARNLKKIALILNEVNDEQLEALLAQLDPFSVYSFIRTEVLCYIFFRRFNALKIDNGKEEELILFMQCHCRTMDMMLFAALCQDRHCQVIFRIISGLVGKRAKISMFLEGVLKRDSIDQIRGKFEKYFLFVNGMESRYLFCLESSLKVIGSFEPLAAILQGIPEEIDSDFCKEIVRSVIRWSKSSACRLSEEEIKMAFLKQRADILKCFRELIV